MADLNYTVDVNTTPAVTSLKKLETQVKGVNDTFNKLKTAIAGISFGALIQGAFNYATAVDQASRATGIAISTVSDFASAVGAAGGNAEKAAGEIIDFVAGLNEAKQGSAGAQAQLAQVGITLSDLGSLSEQDIFKKTVQSLAKMEDAAMRNKLAVQLLGKQFKDLDVRSVADAMGKGNSGDTSGIKAAADASRNFSQALNILQVKLLAALEPVSKLAVEFLKFVTASKEVWSWIEAIGKALLTLAAFTFVGRLFGAIAAAFTTASIASSALATNISVLRVGFMVFKDALKSVVTTGSTIFQGITSAVLVLLQTLKQIKGAVNPVVFDALGAAVTKAAQMITVVFGGAIAGALALWYKFTKAVEDKPTFLDQAEVDRENYLLEQRGKIIEKVIDANRGLQLEMNKNLRGYQEQNTELSRSMRFSNSLIGADETRINRTQKLFDLETAYLSQIKGMQEKYNAMKEAAAVGTKEEELAFASYAKIHEAGMAKITSEYQGQISGVNQLINQEEILKSKEQDRQNTIAAITGQMERQATLGDQIRSAYDKLKDVNFEGEQMKRNPLQKQYAQIVEDARKAAREASLAFSAGFENMDLSAEQAKELANGLEQIAQKYGKIADAQKANLDASRTWEQGWADAFNNYMDNATNAATMASDAFTSITSNMNSAIDNFVETGKFKFSDFARSIIQDLIKIELKAQASKLLSGASNMFGSFLGSIFGFAEGGSPPVNKPSIVGEKGPELFVPKTAGTIIPNGGSVGNAAQGNTYITNNISAIDAKSVAQLFAENRKTLFGSVQMAQKELSYGR